MKLAIENITNFALKAAGFDVYTSRSNESENSHPDLPMAEEMSVPDSPTARGIFVSLYVFNNGPTSTVYTRTCSKRGSRLRHLITFCLKSLPFLNNELKVDERVEQRAVHISRRANIIQTFHFWQASLASRQISQYRKLSPHFHTRSRLKDIHCLPMNTKSVFVLQSSERPIYSLTPGNHSYLSGYPRLEAHYILDFNYKYKGNLRPAYYKLNQRGNRHFISYNTLPSSKVFIN